MFFLWIVIVLSSQKKLTTRRRKLLVRTYIHTRARTPVCTVRHAKCEYWIADSIAENANTSDGESGRPTEEGVGNGRKERGKDRTCKSFACVCYACMRLYGCLSREFRKDFHGASVRTCGEDSNGLESTLNPIPEFRIFPEKHLRVDCINDSQVLINHVLRLIGLRTPPMVPSVV